MARKVTLLPRFGHKGQFVRYPDKWGRRMAHTGKRRFDTSCDLIRGVCACGDKHTDEDMWIAEMLERYNCQIETVEEWSARMAEVR